MSKETEKGGHDFLILYRKKRVDLVRTTIWEAKERVKLKCRVDGNNVNGPYKERKAPEGRIGNIDFEILSLKQQ